MSLEIGEIGVRMAVREHAETALANGAGAALTQDQQARIVQECARLVLQMLQQREAR